MHRAPFIVWIHTQNGSVGSSGAAVADPAPESRAVAIRADDAAASRVVRMSGNLRVGTPPGRGAVLTKCNGYHTVRDRRPGRVMPRV